MISAGYRMPYALSRQSQTPAPTFNQLYRQIDSAIVGMPPLEARGHRPLKMTFDDQLKALIYLGAALLQQRQSSVIPARYELI
jgi:hypothetical protein